MAREINDRHIVMLPRRLLAPWLGAAGILLGLFILTVLPPFVGDNLRMLLMDIFDPVCHQLPGRSFHLHGIPLAVCNRCTGIYGGLAAAALVYPGVVRWHKQLWQYSPWILFLVLLPALLDWSGGLLGLWSNSPTTRVITGLLFGLGAGYYVTRGFTQAIGYLTVNSK